MSLEPNSIDPELLALRAELDSDPATDARQRVLSRLARSVPGLAAGTATGLMASGVVAKVPHGAAPLGLPAKLWLLGAFALGGAAGVVAHATLEAPPGPRVVYVDRLVSAPSAAPSRAEVPVVPNEAPGLPDVVASEPERKQRSSSPQTAPVPDHPVPDAPASLNPPTELPTNTASLAEQQALLDEARAALGRSDGHAALETLRRHTARFPESVLAEEREALAVKALVQQGNVAEARARLDSFERRFPRSPLLPSLRKITREAVTEPNRPRQ